MNLKHLQIPAKLVPVFQGTARYRGAFGSRGSSKTETFCRMLLARAGEHKRRIVCGRQYQNSIRESTHAALISLIDQYDWHNAWDVGESYIIHKRTRSEFIFKGLQHNPQSIKSIADIDILFMDEAEDWSATSWRYTAPSIRAPGSEIWACWNPKSLDSETRRRLILHPPPRSKIVKINWQDNPWFTDELNEERLSDLARDPEYYRHVWEGECITRSDAKVFAGKWVARDFKVGPDWQGPYYGLDFGFARDPLAAVKLWIYNGDLYVDKEAGGVGIEIDKTPRLLREAFPGIERYTMPCDNARPESISYLKRNGLPLVEGVEKWPGSIEDGVTWLRGFGQIIIRPSCSNTLREFDLYSYKVDRHTEKVTRDIVDAENNWIDAIRYALSRMIKVGKKKLDITAEAI